MNETENYIYSLIDRLQKHSEWKYPERKWTKDLILFPYLSIEKHILDIEEKLLKFENEMRLAGVL